MSDRWKRGLLAMLRSAGLLASQARRRARSQPSQPPARGAFRIQVVDKATGRGVPLVELKTVNQIRYVTDSNGVVAFDEPGLVQPQGVLLRHESRLRGRQGQLRLPGPGPRGHGGRVGADLRSSGSTSPSGSTASPGRGSIAIAS